MPEVDLSRFSREQLEEMALAGAQIGEVYRLLRKTGGNVVADVLRGADGFYHWDHYPKGDVYDPETHSQYYYHAHPVEDREGEHGHFHTFLRPKGMPEGVRPAPVADFTPPAGENEALSHLVAVSMNDHGYPVRLFTTNRWVTGETWYRADDVRRMLDHFQMDLAYPSLAVNIWITAMLRLFRPQVEALLDARDRAVTDWQARHNEVFVFEDRGLEITSAMDISVEDQIEITRSALAGH